LLLLKIGQINWGVNPINLSYARDHTLFCSIISALQRTLLPTSILSMAGTKVGGGGQHGERGNDDDDDDDNVIPIQFSHARDHTLF
jgi:hypothetical protein